MRIAFITNNYTPYGAGVVKSIDAYTQQLTDKGHDVIIIAPQFLPVHDDPVHVKRIPSLLRFMYKQKHMAVPWFAKSYLKKYLSHFKPDLIHVHHPFLLGAMGARLAREMKVPVHFTYHTQYEHYAHYVPLPGWLIKPIITTKVLSFCKRVDQIITPSTGIQNYLNQKGITHTTVMPSPVRKEFCNRPFIKKILCKPIQLLCVTRFTKEKNLFVLFEVMKQLSPEYQLTLVGYGDQEFKLREHARQFGNRITFVINPSVEKMIGCYNKAHLFLFPSQTDTQGIVLSESMACGVPVIALDGIGQRDIIKNGINGFIVENAYCMAQSIKKISTNLPLYEQLCIGAYSLIQK